MTGWGSPRHCIVALYVREGPKRERCCSLGSQPAFSHFPCFPQANWALLVLIPGWVGFVYLLGPCRSPMNSPVRLGVSPAASLPHKIFQSEFLRLYFPVLEPWVAWSVSLPSCPSRFICTHMWDCPLHQPLPCLESSPPQLPISAPPTSLKECFFFNFSVVGLPYSSVFWHFWLFFVFRFVVVLLLVV